MRKKVIRQNISAMFSKNEQPPHDCAAVGEALRVCGLVEIQQLQPRDDICCDEESKACPPLRYVERYCRDEEHRDPLGCNDKSRADAQNCHHDDKIFVLHAPSF